MSMTTLATCSSCHASLNPAALGILCPACMMRDLMGEADDSPYEGHELLDEIARGGMGVVYRARNTASSDLVALKALRGVWLDSPTARSRFHHEAELMKTLDHPSILPVHVSGEQDGIPFFTTTLAVGGSLAERLPRYSGQWQAITALMITLCEAVHHAHQRGVLHRDLKPSNVLFDAEDNVFVSDFGIAAKIGDQVPTTSEVIGTPFYLAPEVARDGLHACSVQSDVWSLGVILFELLTGKRPFEGDTTKEVLSAIKTSPPPNPKSLRADVPDDLVRVTMTALAEGTAQRFASAHEFRKSLGA